MTRDSNGSFLARREARTASRELNQMLVLGFGIGFIALGMGSYKYFMVPDVWDAFWSAIAWFGVFALLVTLIYPFVWRGLENILRRVGGWVGHQVMNVLLVCIYYVFFWPVGALLRTTKGTHPIYDWEGEADHDMEGWRIKQLPADVAEAARSSNSRKKHRVGMFGILMFFARRGHFFLIPALVVLASIGIALFFLQTSALAPFIYTLF